MFFKLTHISPSYGEHGALCGELHWWQSKPTEWQLQEQALSLSACGYVDEISSPLLSLFRLVSPWRGPSLWSPHVLEKWQALAKTSAPSINQWISLVSVQMWTLMSYFNFSSKRLDFTSDACRTRFWGFYRAPASSQAERWCKKHSPPLIFCHRLNEKAGCEPSFIKSLASS